MKLKVKIINTKVGNQWPVPHYATAGSAGMDLAACIDHPITLSPGDTKLIPTGIAIHIDDPKVAGIIIPRSGLGHKNGIVMGNLTGLIDSDYQGELLISCWNRGHSIFNINPGDRIAQLVIIPILQPQLEIVDQFNTTDRGKNGFGHSGVK